jgi:hypothetical protein
MFRTLKEEKLVETSARLSQRVSARFPGSGLSCVAAEVVEVTREALVRADSIRRPNWWLRGGLIGLVALVLVVLLYEVLTSKDELSVFREIARFLNANAGLAIYLVASAVFVVTLERRLKRGRAIEAVHELRAMAHIVDMHQLTKDPDQLDSQEAPLEVGGQPMTLETMRRYLHYCTELLALISKIGQLYVQDFPDATALAAVDQCENLATGLSSKIWQKIMILDQMLADAAESACARQTTVSVPVKADGGTTAAKAAEPTGG